MVKRIVLIYVDTNFLLDCSEGREANSIFLMKKISEKECKCVTSAFTMMEISDFKKDDAYFFKKFHKKWAIKRILRERYKKDLTEEDFKDVTHYIVNKILNSYPNLDTVNLNEQGWILALGISTKSNIAIGDAIHLATAWNSNCKYLVTSDKHFIENSEKILKKLKIKNLQVISPKDLLKKRKF